MRAMSSAQPIASDAVPARVNLLGMARVRLEEFMVSLGEKPWRAQQLFKWIYHQGVDDFARMTDVGRALRERLAACAEVRPPQVAAELVSADGTR